MDHPRYWFYLPGFDSQLRQTLFILFAHLPPFSAPWPVSISESRSLGSGFRKYSPEMEANWQGSQIGICDFIWGQLLTDRVSPKNERYCGLYRRIPYRSSPIACSAVSSPHQISCASFPPPWRLDWDESNSLWSRHAPPVCPESHVQWWYTCPIWKNKLYRTYKSPIILYYIAKTI